MEDYKNKLGSLADKLKNESPKTPIQQVQPVSSEPPKEQEVQFNNWIPRSLVKQVKTYGVEHDMSSKDITIHALREFLASNDKANETGDT
ncbi:hypothetical protein BDD43_0853 [Mucilaginibacter gracilis]|uniref:Uncharacterized protein n=1 Tax=Mucilaginibacter gracilis TaxID=423350 RepID=A0A495IWJ0_9SPHI|nr:hypothetical protein [Mucilaginibacter gracilis]RKR80721.1 hypothetical protein BDD43_0853 [Mucilaginibacter gracilis]